MGELIAWGSDIALMREAADALEVVAPDVQVEPVAYAVFADNGNIRIWSADPTQTETLRLEYGNQVQPLYTAPQPAEQKPAPEITPLEASGAGQRAAQAEAATLVEAMERIAAWPDGGGSLFAHGDYDSIKRVQALIFEYEKLQKDAARYQSLLEAVLREIPHRKGNRGNAPGHAHSVPGIWDEDNGALAGKECAWCKVWSEAVSAMQEENKWPAQPTY